MSIAQIIEAPTQPKPWPDPTPEMLKTAKFEAVWKTIKSWDINVPDVYAGYSGATGNHVRAILDSLVDMPEPEKAEMLAAWKEFKETKLFAVLVGHMEKADKLLAAEGTIWGFFYNGYLAGAKR